MKQCTFCQQDYSDPKNSNDYCSALCFKLDITGREERAERARRICKTPHKRMYTKMHAEKRSDERNSVKVYHCACGFYHLATKKNYKKIVQEASKKLQNADIKGENENKLERLEK